MLMGLAFVGVLSAERFVTREEALAAAFPEAQLRSETLFLTRAQEQEAAALSGVDIPTIMIARYTATKDGAVLGRAYVDTHIVRTKKESLLIILDAEGVLLRIETTASAEGPEHQAPKSWYQQYEGRQLSDDLYVDRAIRPIAGATLTARATNQAVRRILAIDRILSGRPENPQ
jgi:hypothetical protein